MSNSPAPVRLDSIDIFRALTMFLMIFVNDFWTLEGVPKWMEHTKAAEDAMGLSDVVFPCFLFIVGLSIPFAISNRKLKGDSNGIVVWHILERTFALLVMGIFLVNLENALGSAMVISKYVWQILLIVAFLLIWNVYPGKDKKYFALKVLGYLLLIALAAVYKGGEPENPTWMGTHWYGILGLIGWSYLIGALAYHFIGDRLALIVLFWVLLNLFNAAEFAGWLVFLDPVHEYVWIVGSGSMPAFVMGGVVASVIYRNYLRSGGLGNTFIIILLALAAVAFVYGFATRPAWGISKIRATPAWVGYCSAVSFAAFAFMFWLVDLQKVKSWAAILKPAGTSTLTCYLVPYVWYAILALISFSLPLFLRTGWIGLLKSAIFALLVIVVTGLLNRVGVKLKI